MSCRQGPSERYAPLGLSLPPLPRRAHPIHEDMGGYAAPKAPAGQTCSDDVFPVTTDDWVPPPQAVLKVLARLKYSVPLYKAESGFSILTEECLTYRTISPCPLTTDDCNNR